MNARSTSRLLCLGSLALSLVGCAAQARSSATDGGGLAQAGTSGGEAASYDDSEMVVTGSRTRRSEFAQPATVQVVDRKQLRVGSGEAKRKSESATYYAEAGAPAAPAPAAPAPTPGTLPEQAAPDAPAVRHDGRTGPLLIYEAQLHLAVYKVEEVQQQAIAAIKELGGFLAVHEDRKRLVLRVPAERFEAALARVEALGEVVHRHVTAQDVSDQFRDLQLRLRNAEAMRDRLALLLDKATNVSQSLEVERELNRISEQIELLKGQLTLLSDRIAFSTLTLDFSPKHAESIEPEFRLPFQWLRDLGLQNLLTLP